jgi:formamidopyrimidine-DNA glycosylase
MPELPEVETIRRHVSEYLKGRTLTGVSLTLPKLMRDSPIPDLGTLVLHEVISARRRAKVLILDWTGDLSLLVHFKLAGQLAIFLPNGDRVIAGHPVPKPDGPYPHKATHVTWMFDDGTVAYFSDVRQFGWLRLLPTGDVEEAISRFNFGPEGTEPGALTASEMQALFARRRIPVKQVLLDQSVIAGLGNIYVDEVLHRSRINPAQPANTLRESDVASIAESIPLVLARGIEQGGAKIVNGKAYQIEGFPAVHGREGEPCMTCGGGIIKTKVGGRGTYSCPVCQEIR